MSGQFDDPENGELAVFVAETIMQIATAVSMAQPIVGKLGGRVNPIGKLPTVNGQLPMSLGRGRFGYLQQIEFDIAITRQTGAKEEGGGGIHVLGIGADGKYERSTDETNASRVRFSLPLVLPGYADEDIERDQQDEVRRSSELLSRAPPNF